MKTQAIEIQKNLITKEDIKFGKGKVQQKRNGEYFNLTGVELVFPVNSIAELRAVNPLEFDSVVVMSNEPLLQPAVNENFKVSEFYKFDFLADNDEDLPRVVKSSVYQSGRWVLVQVGGTKLFETLTEKVAVAKQQVLEELSKGLDEKIVTESKKQVKLYTDAKVLELQKDGGFYDPTITYHKGDLVKVIEGNFTNYQFRYFLVKSAEITGIAPVKGLSYPYGDGGTITFDESEANTDHYIEILPSSGDSRIYQTSSNTTHIYLNPSIGFGTLQIKTRDVNGSVTGMMKVTFLGSAVTEFRIYDVMYSNAVRQDNFMTNSRNAMKYIAHCGFSLHVSSSGIGFDVVDNRYCYTIELTSKDFQIPEQELTRFGCYNSVYKTYALREGGGSFIFGLGDLYQTTRQQNDYIEYDQFQLFMTGRIPWFAALRLNSTAYHQLTSCCTEGGGRYNYDPTNRYLKASSSTPGDFGSQSLPNIKGEIGEQESGSDLTGLFNNASDLVSSSGCFQKGRSTRWTNEYIERYRGHTILFDASRSNSIYQDNAAVHPNHINIRLLLQAF